MALARRPTCLGGVGYVEQKGFIHVYDSGPRWGRACDDGDNFNRVAHGVVPSANLVSAPPLSPRARKLWPGGGMQLSMDSLVAFQVADGVSAACFHLAWLCGSVLGLNSRSAALSE